MFAPLASTYKFLTGYYQVAQLSSIDLVRIEGGNASAVKVRQDDKFEDEEANARAHGFRRMIERVAPKVVTMTRILYLVSSSV